MLFELFDDEALFAPKTDLEMLSLMQPLLQHEHQELLVYVLEGFTKLLFMNRLKHCKNCATVPDCLMSASAPAPTR